MLRRLHHEQPDSFAFTPANQAWAEAQMTKYPEGRQASAIIPLLWRAQEQEGWLSRPAIEAVADMLGLAYIRALEVATAAGSTSRQPGDGCNHHYSAPTRCTAHVQPKSYHSYVVLILYCSVKRCMTKAPCYRRTAASLQRSSRSSRSISKGWQNPEICLAERERS